MDVNDNLIRPLLEQRAAQACNHTAFIISALRPSAGLRAGRIDKSHDLLNRFGEIFRRVHLLCPATQFADRALKDVGREARREESPRPQLDVVDGRRLG